MYTKHLKSCLESGGLPITQHPLDLIRKSIILQPTFINSFIHSMNSTYLMPDKIYNTDPTVFKN